MAVNILTNSNGGSQICKFISTGELVDKIHESWSSIGLVINGNALVSEINYFQKRGFNFRNPTIATFSIPIFAPYFQ